ncbi:MAG: DUF4339 domain-containing protein, partial [Chitinophagia bacterium]|nr:DUF4339 domain-containing protein [Chitinophagia bacterium]
MRAYHLLRNNKKTGPYSFEELLAMQLICLDLIWVEGQSQCWKYPSELEEFSTCDFAKPVASVRLKPGTEALPGISFRLPDHELSSQSWGPVPTLALRGLNHFMFPPTRHRVVNLQTDEGHEGPSLFSVLPLSDRSARVPIVSGNGLPQDEE